MIVVEGLSVSFGAVQALRDVSFEAQTGKITAVLGSNGAGKTTLLRTISGLKEPASGSVMLNERSLLHVKPENIARLGVCPRAVGSSASSRSRRTCASAP